MTETGTTDATIPYPLWAKILIIVIILIVIVILVVLAFIGIKKYRNAKPQTQPYYQSVSTVQTVNSDTGKPIGKSKQFNQKSTTKSKTQSKTETWNFKSPSVVKKSPKGKSPQKGKGLSKGKTSPKK